MSSRKRAADDERPPDSPLHQILQVLADTAGARQSVWSHSLQVQQCLRTADELHRMLQVVHASTDQRLHSISQEQAQLRLLQGALGMDRYDAARQV